MDRVLARFADPAGGFFDTADDHERLVARPQDPQDNAVPSGNAMATSCSCASRRGPARAGIATRPRRRSAPSTAYLPTLPDRLRPVARGPRPGARAGRRGRDRRGPERPGDAGAPRRDDPAGSGRTRSSRSAPTPDASAIPLLADRVAIDGRPTAYVCRGFVCRLPVTDADALRGRNSRRSSSDGPPASVRRDDDRGPVGVSDRGRGSPPGSRCEPSNVTFVTVNRTLGVVIRFSPLYASVHRPLELPVQVPVPVAPSLQTPVTTAPTAAGLVGPVDRDGHLGRPARSSSGWSCCRGRPCGGRWTAR